jgi:hypothetical protein
VDNFRIRRLGWACHIRGMEDLRIPKKVLNGKFRNKDKWENKEQDGRMSSRTHHRSYEYRMEKMSRRHRSMEVSSEIGQGPKGAVTPQMDGWMELQCPQTC